MINSVVTWLCVLISGPEVFAPFSEEYEEGISFPNGAKTQQLSLSLTIPAIVKHIPK